MDYNSLKAHGPKIAAGMAALFVIGMLFFNKKEEPKVAQKSPEPVAEVTTEAPAKKEAATEEPKLKEETVEAPLLKEEPVMSEAEK